jgi:hypothetical protein
VLPLPAASKKPSSGQQLSSASKARLTCFTTRASTASTSSCPGGGSTTRAPLLHTPSGTSRCRCGAIASALLNICVKLTAPPFGLPTTPTSFARCRCQRKMAFTRHRSTRLQSFTFFTTLHLNSRGKDSVH